MRPQIYIAWIIYPPMQVSAIPGAGFDANVYLVSDARHVLIDAGTGFNERYVRNSIEKHIALEDVAAIVLTHEHFDHCGGVADLRQSCDADVHIHEDGAAVLEEGQDWSAAWFGRTQEPTEIHRKLHDKDTIQLGSATLQVLHTPGHSPGSICLYEGETESLFSGDLIFANGGVGRTDFTGGDASMLAHSVHSLDIPVGNLYPGHGPYIEGDGQRHVDMAAKAVQGWLD